MDNRIYKYASGDVVDIVIIIGEDHTGKAVHQRYSTELAELCQRKKLSFITVGSGKSGATLDDLKKLPRANHVAWILHGIIFKDRHYFVLNRQESTWESVQTFFTLLPKPGAYPSLDLLKSVQEQTGAESVVVGSCFGGLIADELSQSKQRELAPETCLFIMSPSKEPSYFEDTILVFNDFIKKISPGKKANMIELVRDSIKLNPNTMVFAFQPGDDKKPVRFHVIRRTERAKNEICMEVEPYCKEQDKSFYEFADLLCKENHQSIIQQVESSSYPSEFKMTANEKQNYHRRSFERHVLYNDITIVERLLASIQFTAMFYMKVLFDALDEAITKNNNLIPMVKLLLAHKEQTINWEGKATFNEAMERHINSKGFNPLTLAIEHENIEITELLLQHGADINLPDQKERVPINLMAANSKFQPLYEKYANSVTNKQKI